MGTSNGDSLSLYPVFSAKLRKIGDANNQSSESFCLWTKVRHLLVLIGCTWIHNVKLGIPGKGSFLDFPKVFTSVHSPDGSTSIHCTAKISGSHRSKAPVFKLSKTSSTSRSWFCSHGLLLCPECTRMTGHYTRSRHPVFVSGWMSTSETKDLSEDY